MTAYAEPDVHRMTVEEYETYVAATGQDRTELIDGVVYDVSPEQNLHANAVWEIQHLLAARLPARRVMTSGSVRMDDGSLWEPDVYVIDAAPGFVFPTYPRAADLLLAVEVSVSTWSRDAGLKRDVYARDGVPEYWVIDPKEGGVVMRHTLPDESSYAEFASKPLTGGLRTLVDTWDAVMRLTPPT